MWYITCLTFDGTYDSMVFATRLRRLRTQRNFSQREIAERIGVPKDYVALVERGQTVPSLETLERFAKVLDVPLHKLFYDGRAPTTRHLTPRPSLQELADEIGPMGAKARFLLQVKVFARRFDQSSRDSLLGLVQRFVRGILLRRRG